ncbi:unnamed protein product [Hydatigera taeniaeformis]|uniref:Uncharacterized protein n=1 Tax=Hydatigena taeniaeformis TaxID=6205 RepID=A0A0R3WMV2_HYDTA|nr:unnamed protein product [Hydatigera taeniaeformis]
MLNFLVNPHTSKIPPPAHAVIKSTYADSIVATVRILATNTAAAATYMPTRLSDSRPPIATFISLSDARMKWSHPICQPKFPATQLLIVQSPIGGSDEERRHTNTEFPWLFTSLCSTKLTGRFHLLPLLIQCHDSLCPSTRD